MAADFPRTIWAAAHALAAGTVTSRALVDQCLARARDPEGEGPRSFTKLYDDQARATADAMDMLRRHGRAPGPLCGIPVTIKDLFDVAGETTAAGSRVLRDALPASRHATIIARLLGAGLVLIGRTTMTEFAFSGVGINPHDGTPLSPWDRATGRIPGGSSSGAAVSVADGFALGAIGTDTGGSCRIPAALCGITGFKPTARRVPLDGIVPLSPTLDSIGPLAPSAACCAALDAVISGNNPEPLPDIALSGLRLAIPTNFAFDHIDTETEAAFDRAVRILDRAGAIIERRPFAVFEDMASAQRHGGFAAAEAYAWHREHLARDQAAYDPRVAQRILGGRDMSVDRYFDLATARRALIAQFGAEIGQADALIMPTVPIMPPALAEFAEDESYRRLNFLLLRNPAAINFLDGCAISVPCHAPGAPPAGLMIAAPGGRDQLILRIGAAFEAEARRL